MDDKMTIKRLNVLMPAELFTTIKKVAVDNNCTMTKFVMRAIIEKLKREGELEKLEEQRLK